MSEGDWIPREWTDQHHSIQTEKTSLVHCQCLHQGCWVCLFHPSCPWRHEKDTRVEPNPSIRWIYIYIYSKYKNVCITIQYMHCRYTVSYPNNFRNKNIMLQTKTKILKKKFSHRCFCCLRGPSPPGNVEIMNHPCPWKGWKLGGGWADGPLRFSWCFCHPRFFSGFLKLHLKTLHRYTWGTRGKLKEPESPRIPIVWLVGMVKVLASESTKSLRLNTPYLNTPILHKWNALKFEILWLMKFQSD